MVALDPRMATRAPHELSGGQQQRVALARALAREPRLMLLDEPFSALDAGLRESMRQAVGQVLRDAGVTTILVTHDQAEALSFADQVAVMRDGTAGPGRHAARALPAPGGPRHRGVPGRRDHPAREGRGKAGPSAESAASRSTRAAAAVPPRSCCVRSN